MIPLRDTVPSYSFPVVTVGLIVVNVFVFLHELSLGPALDRFILQHGFVPARYLYVSEAEPWNFAARFGPMVSSMFLHGGWLHLIGNAYGRWCSLVGACRWVRSRSIDDHAVA
jgi:membrane associated rhomboid family serine protease